MANHEGSIRCFRQRSCSKYSGHPGKCDKRFYNKINNCFWETSKPQLENASKKLKEDIEILENNTTTLRESTFDAEIKLNNIEFETCEINTSKEILNTSLSDIRIEKDDLEKEVELLQQQHEKSKSMLNQKQFCRTKRELNPTTFENINDSANRTRYNRRIETKNILEYIHGGLSGALLGAWDFILGYGDDDQGKWYQIMRSGYARTFYLPYHFPTSTYYSHNTCRVPKEDVDDFEICSCSQKLNVGENVCSICANSEIIKAAENGEISENILHILKPIQCHECQLRFPDKIRCDGHIRTVHQRNITRCHLDVRTLTLMKLS